MTKITVVQAAQAQKDCAAVMRAIEKSKHWVRLCSFASSALIGGKRKDGGWDLWLLVFPKLSSINPTFRKKLEAKGVRTMVVEDAPPEFLRSWS